MVNFIKSRCLVKISLFLRSTKILSSRLLSSKTFAYERVDKNVSENLHWWPLIGDKSMENYIPLTRKQLIEAISGDKQAFDPVEIKDFTKFCYSLDNILRIHNKKRLKELKSLYNPISPERDTIQLERFNEKQLEDRKTDVLEQISKLASEAAFYELSEEFIKRTLQNITKREKFDLYVNTDEFEVLKIWVIGLDVAPLDRRSLYKKARSYRDKTSNFLDPQDHIYHDHFFMKKKAFKNVKPKIFPNSPQFPRIERYKRVLVAFRLKSHTKLHLKAFKDIPCDNLEFLLPEGVLKTRSIDKARVTITGILLVLIYGVGVITDYKLQTTLAISTTAFIIVLRTWSAYQSLINKYIMNWSKTLYFKTIANNHALLTLLADRSEDELYKTAILICCFLRSRGNNDAWISEKELTNKIQQWVYQAFKVNIKFRVNIVADILESRNIISSHDKGGEKRYMLSTIQDMASAIPTVKRNPHAFTSDALFTDIVEHDEKLYEEEFKWD